MIIDPNTAFNWLKYAKKENIQQSGVDLTLKSIHKIQPGGTLTKEGKKIVHLTEVKPVACGYMLMPGEYDFTCEEYVEVPTDCIAAIVQRSSLNRLGAFITTGVYDNSFKNYIGGVLHIPHPIIIEEGARIAQIVFYNCEHEAEYQGQYQDRGQNELTV